MHDPRVPETLEGWSVLHQMFRVRWSEWQALAAPDRGTRAAEAAQALAGMQRGAEGTTVRDHAARPQGRPDARAPAAQTSSELQAAQLAVARLGLAPFLEPTTSFVSIVELGMYEMTAHDPPPARRARPGRGLRRVRERRSTPRWRSSAGACRAGCSLEVPPRRYVCFYPMNKRRGEHKNWYAEPVEDRARMMRDHGKIGRHYAGQVTQMISGSIGFDDWEWGVDLFADDPLVFKKLIYEMRFDEASAWYAEFGPVLRRPAVLAVRAAEVPRGRGPGVRAGRRRA